jgi:heme-degrading monooxygenase HmoA
VESGEWYVVAFRSIRSAGADPELLKALDDRAYEEATREPGLLLYFRGSMNERHECLSICVWESRERAQAATKMPLHRAAAKETDALYTLFELERWILSKRRGSGTLEIRPVRVEAGPAVRYASAVTQDRAGRWFAMNADHTN